MLRRACLAFWMLPRSGFRFLRNTSSCCCPAQRPRTHSLFTCSTGSESSLNTGFQDRLCVSIGGSDYLDDTEAEVSSIEHYDFILVGAFVEDVAQREERLGVGQHGAPPGRVALVSDDQVLLVGGDGLEKNCRLVVLVRRSEVVLMRRRSEVYSESDSNPGSWNTSSSVWKVSPGVI